MGMEFAADNRSDMQITGSCCQGSVACLPEKRKNIESEGLCCRGDRNVNTIANVGERIPSDIVSESKVSRQIRNLANDVLTDGNAALNGEASPSQHCQGQHHTQTVEDMDHQHDLFFDDDEDDDSDWEPFSKHANYKRWFCINCTMPNYDNVVHCDVCGEFKESEILKLGFYASQLGPGAQTNMVSELANRHEGCSTAVGFDERMLLHSEVEMKLHPHPERPDRLRAIAASLASSGIFPGKCFCIPSREITKEELQMVHSLEHIQSVELTSSLLSSYFTQDTYANEHSACAARLAAGLCADLASAILSGQAKNGFALVRPPGHHAGVKQAMGFCLHNNASVAALAALAANAKKVLIVDWDVHHGNGTQEIFEANKSVLYISLHRHEGGLFYPGTGAVDEVGSMGAEGFCVNVPWKYGGVGDNDYIFAFQHVVLPIASEFSPDLTIISAGFDAARGDPLGCCDVTPAGFAQMAHMLSGLSDGKLLVILEGGYNLRSISSSAVAVIKVLLGESPEDKLPDAMPSKAGFQTVLEVIDVQTKYWPVLQTSYSSLLSLRRTLLLQMRKKKPKRRRRLFIPMWWKWGCKMPMYHMFCRGIRVKGRRYAYK